MNIAARIPERVQRLTPYQCARDIYSGDYTFLDANESPAEVYPSPMSAVQLSRYPDPYARELRAALAGWSGVRPEQVFVGGGSDEILDLIYKGLADWSSQRVLSIDPTYGVYQILAETYGMRFEPIGLGAQFSLDLAAISAALRPETQLVFLCSPNNPTGQRLDPLAIRQLCRQAPGFVILDEAYIEFCAEPDGVIPSLVGLVESLPNLIVVRTLSKAWGLAGLRLGWAVADPVVIKALDKVKEPYNLGADTQRTALQAVREPERMLANVRQLVAERERLQAGLAKLAWAVIPSETNFFCLRVPGSLVASDLQRELAEQHGIVVRDRSNLPGLENCLRISIGTAEENDRLLKAISIINRRLA